MKRLGRPPTIHIGEKYGFLMVTGEGIRDRHGNRKWECLCDCGTSKQFYAWQLRTNDSVSCGCKKGGDRRSEKKSTVRE